MEAEQWINTFQDKHDTFYTILATWIHCGVDLLRLEKAKSGTEKIQSASIFFPC